VGDATVKRSKLKMEKEVILMVLIKFSFPEAVVP
jgi:hypothetical protein